MGYLVRVLRDGRFKGLSMRIGFISVDEEWRLSS